MSVSLYIHIPFCVKRCIYCDFVSNKYDTAKVRDYMDALKKEIATIPGSSRLSTLYIGGGTPTVLEDNALRALISFVFNRFSFDHDYEATIEANPGTIDRRKLKMLKAAGINRISIGVQSFNDPELSFLGRIHTADMARDAITLAREAGFENIGIDLMYGLPGQSITEWEHSLDIAISCAPSHISTYELTLEEGTQLYKVLKNPAYSKQLRIVRGDSLNKVSALPEDDIITMFNAAIDYLSSSGFNHYEISNFALKGNECRHNLNYWSRGDYFGAGCGAHSFIDGIRRCNKASLDKYINAFAEGKSPVEYSEIITPQMAVSEEIYLGMRKTDGICIDSIARKYGINILSKYKNEIEELIEPGLIELKASECSYETMLKLTKKGIPLSNEVFRRFL